jgi:serine/threonine protein kinase
MAAPTTVERFLELIRQSGVTEAERLDDFLRQNTTLPAEPPALADQLVAEGLLTPFQRDQLLRGKWRGFTLGKYRILEPLGRGGMGTVFLAEHVVMRRRVAVKVLPKIRADQPSAIQRFHREARAAAALDHPNVIRAHDVDCEGKIHFLVMEYVDGVSLQALVETSGPLEVARACHYAYQAAAGLHSLHQAGLVHRDVKPGNILVDRQGTVKVLDLGLARFYEDNQDQLTGEIGGNAIMGTADFLSPEQGLNSHEVDARGDVYSLGATLYYLLAGRVPFEGQTITEKLLRHQMEDPPPLASVRPEVPEGLAAVVARMMAKAPADRYQSAAEAAAALVPWVTGPVPPLSEKECARLSPAAKSGRSPAPYQGPNTFPAVPEREPAAPRPGSLRIVGSEVSQTPLAPSRPLVQEAPLSVSDVPTQLALPRFGPSRPRRWWTLVIVGLVLLIGGLAAGLHWAFHRSNPTPPPTPPSVGLLPPPLPAVQRLSGETGQTEDFPTVAAALAKAKPGDRVLVRTNFLEERLVLKGITFPEPGVTLEAGAPSGQPVAWVPAETHPGGLPLVDLSDVSGLRLKGFLLDGARRLDSLVFLSGRCPGLCLEGLQLKGFRGCGVQLRDCAGELEQPVVLSGIRLFAGDENGFAFVLRGAPEAGSRDVHVLDGRLEGPLQAGVQVAGSVVGVQFQGNRFHKLTDAFQIHKVEPGQQVLFNVTSNTFAEVQNGFHFLRPPSAKQVRLTVANNLFAKTKKLSLVDDFTPQPANVRARWIWYDEPRPTGVEARYFRTTFQVPATATITRATLDLTCDHAFTVWLNGQRIGQGELNVLTRRVYAFDVTAHLRKGKNVLAIQGTNRSRLDGTAPMQGGLLAQLTYVPRGGTPSMVAATMPKTWRASKQGPKGWQNLDFDEEAWSTTKLLYLYGQGPPTWHNLIWDSTIAERFHGSPRPVLISPKGNLRDRASGEGFPLLDTRFRDFTLPTNPTDDVHFLRYPRSNRTLSEAGPGKTPVGAPPVE